MGYQGAAFAIRGQSSWNVGFVGASAFELEEEGGDGFAGTMAQLEPVPRT